MNPRAIVSPFDSKSASPAIGMSYESCQPSASRDRSDSPRARREADVFRSNRCFRSRRVRMTSGAKSDSPIGHQTASRRFMRAQGRLRPLHFRPEKNCRGEKPKAERLATCRAVQCRFRQSTRISLDRLCRKVFVRKETRAAIAIEAQPTFPATIGLSSVRRNQLSAQSTRREAIKSQRARSL
jgi:hypothetical protein